MSCTSWLELAPCSLKYKEELLSLRARIVLRCGSGKVFTCVIKHLHICTEAYCEGLGECRMTLFPPTL